MPIYADEPLKRYLDDAAAREPTPGGGSVSALTGALACTMAQMAANFTVGNKKFKDVEADVRECLDELRDVGAELLELMQRDTEAYAELNAAYGMPKDSPAQKEARTAAIQQALVAAMTPPLQTVRACARAMRATAQLADIANPNLISDVGVAALLAEAAMQAAKLNVEVNLAYLKDEDMAAQTRAEVAQLIERARELAAETIGKVHRSLGVEE